MHVINKHEVMRSNGGCQGEEEILQGSLNKLKGISRAKNLRCYQVSSCDLFSKSTNIGQNIIAIFEKVQLRSAAKSSTKMI